MSGADTNPAMGSDDTLDGADAPRSSRAYATARATENAVLFLDGVEEFGLEAFDPVLVDRLRAALAGQERCEVCKGAGRVWPTHLVEEGKVRGGCYMESGSMECKCAVGRPCPACQGERDE